MLLGLILREASRANVPKRALLLGVAVLMRTLLSAGILRFVEFYADVISLHEGLRDTIDMRP